MVRYTQSGDGKIVLQIDFRHKEDPIQGWIPASWRTIVMRPDGTLQTSVAAEVSSYAINPVIETKEFEIDFPEGTMVYDKETKSEFIVRPDGGRRVITDAERARCMSNSCKIRVGDGRSF